MIIGAILLGILIFAVIIFASRFSEDSSDFNTGLVIGAVIVILFAIEIGLVSDIIGVQTPSALDVYRGNTELEITSVNGTPIDTVVVFK